MIPRFRFLPTLLFLPVFLLGNPSDYCPQPPWCYQDQSRFTPAERAVCSDEILSIADNLLSSVYRHLQFVDPEPGELEREEAEWLRLRNSITDRDQLMLLYIRRIEVLARRLARGRGTL